MSTLIVLLLFHLPERENLNVKSLSRTETRVRCANEDQFRNGKGSILSSVMQGTVMTFARHWRARERLRRIQLTSRYVVRPLF